MSQKSLYDLTLNINAKSAELSKGIKEANQKITGFQQNVEDQMKKVKTAFIAVTGVLASLKGTLEFVKLGMNSTGQGADDLTRNINKLKGGFEELAASIVKGDFENLIASFKRGVASAAQFTDEIDLMETRLQDLNFLKAKLEGDIQGLRVKQTQGTITKEEIKKLEELTTQLHNTEVEIYNRAIDATYEMMATQKGLNADLFKNIEQGIEARAKLNNKEWEVLDESVNNWKKYYEEIKKQYTSIETFNPGGDSMPINVVKTNMDAVNKSMEEYFRTLSGPEQAQIVENLFSSPEEWNQLLNFLTKRNELAREYNRLNLQVSRASSKIKPSTLPVDVPIVESVNTNFKPMDFGIPELVDEGELALLELEKTWADIAEEMGNSTTHLADAFLTLGDAIRQASEDGQVSFSESMNIMAKSATSLISVMQALAIAGIIKNEAITKGAIGVFTAVAAIASIIGMFTQYTNPNKYFTGTNYSAGGWSLVGERGPELLNLPQGSRILSNPETHQAMSGGKYVFELGNGVLEAAQYQSARFKRSYA